MDWNQNEKDAELYRELENYKSGYSQNPTRIRELSQEKIYGMICDAIYDQEARQELLKATYVRIFNELSGLSDVQKFYSWAENIVTNLTYRYRQEKQQYSSGSNYRGKKVAGITGIGVVGILLFCARVFLRYQMIQERHKEPTQIVSVPTISAELNVAPIETGESLYNKGVLALEQEKYAQAYDYFLQATLKQYIPASYALGNMYYQGVHVREDVEMAVGYWEIAYKGGYMEAALRLGWVYENGIGIEQDYAKAVEYYTAAAEDGNGVAMCRLGNLYFEGAGVAQDYTKAYEYYLAACDAGEDDAVALVGYMYEMGFGVEQDYAKAIEYYEEGVAIQNIESAESLGYLYFMGMDAEPDYEQAYEYFEMAYTWGSAVAAYNIGYMYENGYGVEQDYTNALTYYQVAYERGYTAAEEKIATLEEAGYSSEETDDSKSLQTFLGDNN